MAQIYVAGPAEIHVSIYRGSNLRFLGWTEAGVNIHIRGEWDDVPADLAGTRMPADVQAMGEQYFAAGDLKIWNQDVYNQIAARANFAVDPEGSLGQGSIGRLMIAEGLAYRVLIYAPYSVLKPSQVSFKSYNFLNAWLAGPDVINPYGSRASKIRVLFRGINAYDCQSGKWLGYNHDASGKPGVC